MTCHFVYAVPSKGYIGRIKRHLCQELQYLGLPVSIIGDRRTPDMSWWPAQSPYENTKHIFQGFSSLMPTLLYDLRERVRCKFSSDDIFLGHPSFPYQPGKKGVTELSLEQSCRPRIFALISPLHCDVDIQTSHINRPYLEAVGRLLERADVLFAIMGQYWWDQWPNSPFAHWLPKMVRLDMAVDTNLFPRVKNKFNPPGKRGYLYIGRNDPMKGTDLLSRLARAMPECRFGWIGYGEEIKGVPRISPSGSLMPEFMMKVARDFDFFISPSVADPNPTTILESMAWGFPVICTPQSGYYETSYRKNIYHDDLDRSVSVLRELQIADEIMLRSIADEARAVVEKEYTWDKFNAAILRWFKL
jgi:glycosyltransferase involved in cell wall biosynthesis